MNVVKLGENSWQIEADKTSQTGKRQWWTATRLPHLPYGWLIMNSRGTQVSPIGAMGTKILRAINDA